MQLPQGIPSVLHDHLVRDHPEQEVRDDGWEVLLPQPPLVPQEAKQHVGTPVWHEDLWRDRLGVKAVPVVCHLTPDHPPPPQTLWQQFLHMQSQLHLHRRHQ